VEKTEYVPKMESSPQEKEEKEGKAQKGSKNSTCGYSTDESKKDLSNHRQRTVELPVLKKAM